MLRILPNLSFLQGLGLIPIWSEVEWQAFWRHVELSRRRKRDVCR